jgi:hypothetical protein
MESFCQTAIFSFEYRVSTKLQENILILGKDLAVGVLELFAL